MTACQLTKQSGVLTVAVDDTMALRDHVLSAQASISRMILEGVLPGGDSTIRVRGTFSTPVALTLAHRLNQIFGTVAISYPNPDSDRFVVSYTRDRKHDVGDLLFGVTKSLFDGDTYDLRLRQQIFRACMHFTKLAQDSREDAIFQSLKEVVGLNGDAPILEEILHPVIKIDRSDAPTLAAMIWADHLIRPSHLFKAIPTIAPRTIVPSAVAVSDPGCVGYIVTCVNEHQNPLPYCVGDCID